MKIYAIVAHDKPTSLTKTLFNHCIEQLRSQDVTIDVLDLYERASEIPFYISDRPTLEAHPFYQENKERFLAADRLLIAFPVYWYSTPGILKCWFDLINQFAWKFDGMYKPAIARHKIKKALVINSLMTPWWYNRFILGDPAREQVRLTLKFLNIEPLMYTVDRSNQMNQQVLLKHFKNIEGCIKKILI